MAATGKTPILLYGSTTATNVPVAANLTNSSDGCEIAINVADKNLFFKDSSNVVNTVPIRQSSASSSGWLSSTDWSTFNSKVSSQWTTSGSNIYYTAGNVTVNTGNLVIGTSGKGIDFSATAGTGTSELLADYEEGTWTPSFSFSGGSTGITYSTQTGRYTKIGRMVYVYVDITLTSKGSSTGYAVINGLPYTTSDYSSGVIDPVQGFSGLTAGGAVTTGVSATTMYLFLQGTSNRNLLQDTNIQNNMILRAYICYEV